MSDRVFSGKDVEEALSAAAHALGVSPERLRYVVLDAGSVGGLGLSATPARVAVLLGGRGVEGAVPARPAAAPLPRPVSPPAEPGDPAPEVVDLVAALARCAGLDLRAEVEPGEDAVVVWLRGGDAPSFLLGEREAEVLAALDHLLHGIFARRFAPLRFRVECEGRREHREARLRADARALADQVRADGQPRTTEPLNSYERRLVHVAVSELAGLITYSVGDGPDRRVTIAPEKASLGGEVH